MVRPRRSNGLVLLGILLISGWYVGTPALQGQDSSTLGPVEGSITIEWENLESSYRVQVRRGGQVFIDTTITENQLNLDLAPGDYQYKVAVLNPFGKIISESEWLPLGVQQSRVPYFRIRPPVVAWEGDTGLSLNVESAYLREQTVFQLQYGEISIPLDRTGTGGAYNLVIPDDSAGPGSWNLKATDPSGRSFTFPEALIVRPIRSPEVARPADPAALPASGITPITVEGTAFDIEMTVRFTGPGGDIPVAALEISDGRSAVAYLNLEGAIPGSYDLVAVNPAGDKTIIEDYLTVTEAEKTEPYRRQPRFGFQMGWAPMWIDIPNSDTDLPSYMAFEIAGLFQSGMKSRFFRGLGLETRVMFGISGPADVPDASVDFISSLDVSGYYRPLVTGKVAPVFLLGVGNLWSGYAGKYGIENILFIRTGIGMDVTSGHDVFRLGVNFGWGFAGETLPMISLMFRRGMSY